MSNNARGEVNYQVHNIVGMLASVLPYYLFVVKFYDERPELKTSSKYCGINELERISHKYITTGVPQQRDDSLDCGVYVAAFAELVSNGQDILNEEINSEVFERGLGLYYKNMLEGSRRITFKVKTKDHQNKYSYISSYV